MPRDDIAWALHEVNSTRRRAAYKLHRDYYEGEHRQAFSKERFRKIFNGIFEAIDDNLCPAVVDAVADRLKLTGFSSTASRQRRRTVGGRTREVVSDPLASRAWQIWGRNSMGLRANEVHRDALITGDGYVIVWPDAEGRPWIWPTPPEEVAVLYSEQVPGELVRAARVWKDEQRRLRVNLFYPNHTERYVSRNRDVSGARAAFDEVASPDDMQIGGETVDGVVENPYGRVPVFHFANKRLYAPGVSELVDVIPLQDGLNKAVCDMFIAMEFASYRQRYATGLDVDYDQDGKPIVPFRPGPDRLWITSPGEKGDETVEFGEFTETELTQFLEVQENLRAETARVSGTPLHYLFITKGDFPSGEAMKSAEARFSGKLDDRQQGFGSEWARALAFALQIEGARLPNGFTLTGRWVPATPRSDEEVARTLILKRKLGVSRYQALREAGYSDDTIEQMLEQEPDDPIDDPALSGDLNPGQ